MPKIISVERMRAVEAAADAAGYSYDAMMQDAGHAAAERIKQLLRQRAHTDEPTVTFLIGPGNNGGDGLVAARALAEAGSAQVRVYLFKSRDDDPLLDAAQKAGIFIVNADDDQRQRVLTNLVASSTVIVDALFGIGLELPLRPEAAKLLRAVKGALGGAAPDSSATDLITPESAAAEKRALRPYVIALDCPSGLDCDSGALDANTLHADETVTFIACKPGLLTFPGAAAVGKLTVAPLAMPASTAGLNDEPRELISAVKVAKLLPRRARDGNKGTFGKALIAAGSVNYVGAPALCALSAYRAGAGLVTIATPTPVASMLAGDALEATWLLLPHDLGVIAESAFSVLQEELKHYDALLVGPGIGREKTTGEFIAKLLKGSPTGARARRPIGFSALKPETEAGQASADESAGAQLPPLVIDADALNLIAELDGVLQNLPAETIITPHPGEMARLCGLSVDEVVAQRWSLATQKASEWNVIVVLKGAHTIAAHPDGRTAVMPFKTSALATAGTGDVLAGLIVGLIVQGVDLFDAAVAGAYLHGLAGQAAEQRVGSARAVIASDVLASIGDVYRQIELLQS